MDDAWYRRTYPDVAIGRLSAQAHYRRHGAREGRDPNPYFDTDWYLEHNPDVEASGMNPLDHYYRFGVQGGRDPSPFFDTDWYLLNNPDVAAAGIHPLLHYIRSGREEGRAPRRSYGVPGSWPDRDDSHLSAVFSGARPAVPLPSSTDVATSRLVAFLSSDQRLTFPVQDRPAVSVVIPTYGQARLSHLALASLLETAGEVPIEVVVVDNASSDETRDLLARTDNVEVILNEQNIGFGHACGQGVARARAGKVAFLNSDTVVTHGWLAPLVETLDGNPQAAAVGSRLIHLNGRLQEAGGIVWRDGSVSGYGRGEDPLDPAFGYVRPVDFCSAAALLVGRETFIEAGGFDQRYAPAYYEDVDLGLTLWHKGGSVLYQPRSAVFHLEFGSSPSQGAPRLQQRNRERFVGKWQTDLEQRDEQSRTASLRRRDRRQGLRVLLIDDRIPEPSLGSGAPRTRAIVKILADRGYVITFLPTLDRLPVEPTTGELQQAGIEVLWGVTDIHELLRSRHDLYDVAVVSRPHNARFIRMIKDLSPKTRVVYDAEAVYSVRTALQAQRLGGHEGASVSDLIEREMNLVQGADIVVAVTEREAGIFREHSPSTTVVTFGTAVETRRSTPAFEDRSGLLFVGNLSTPPNSDAMVSFLEATFPVVRERFDCRLTVVGGGASEALHAAAGVHASAVDFIGRVDDLGPYYDRARLFVAPHRFAAGLPLKVVDAMANGLPCLVSELLGDQLDLTREHRALAAPDSDSFVDALERLYSDSVAWQQSRELGLALVESRYSYEAGADLLAEVIG
ncbi:MAG TPA: glycosyltransferase [Candidatus Limnocylindrales bacterium]|nr:glycosyltransferase [Candidatus Limnocylindrales bacterium]